MKKATEMNDPSRIPHLQYPIDNFLLGIHKKVTTKILKEIGEEIKKKK